MSLDSIYVASSSRFYHAFAIGTVGGACLIIASATKADRDFEDRRKLGAFYTPMPLSEILADWVIRSASDCVLEPSFGGCGFLQAAFNRLDALGTPAPKSQIFGCDIDPVAFDYLAHVLGSPVDLKRFLRADFLSVTSSPHWPAQFPAILANPPYIPYQAIDAARRNELGARDFAIKGVAGRASLWAYFMAHATSLLAPEGRMAWVLPGAFLHADYAAPIRRYLAARFRRAVAIVLHERIFLEEGTDEETVILLADGHSAEPLHGRLDIADASSLQSLRAKVAEWDAGTLASSDCGRPATLSLSASTQDLLSRLDTREDSKTLGALASVQIGLVMGANKFFVLRREELSGAGLEDADCTPILGKFQAVHGLSFTKADHDQHLTGGGRGLLAGDATSEPSERLALYFARFGQEERAKIGTFRKRRIWWRPHDGRIADAFFPVMHHYGPRIVLNADKCANTNTIHRVYFKDALRPPQRKLIAISILTTYAQLSAELVGRRYGSGVLKHEPREAERIRLLLPPISTKRINAAFKRIDTALRKGDRGLATQLADDLIYAESGLEDPQGTSKTLEVALNIVRTRRRPERRVRDLASFAPATGPHDVERG